MGGIGHKYTKEEDEFIKSYGPGHSWKEIQEAFKNEFGWSITTGQVKNRLIKLKVKTGHTGRFGDVPAYNKGKKMSKEQYEKAESTMFKKGNIPPNTAEIGKEVITSYGYIKVKVANPRKWRWKHYLVWEEANGPKPPNTCLIFLDQNKLNCELDNLVLVDKRVEHILNRNQMLTDDPEINKVMINIAKCMDAAGIGNFDASEKTKRKRAQTVLKRRRKEV